MVLRGLGHRQLANNGIYTIEKSVDGSTWTSVGTVDGYAAAGASTRSELTGLTFPTGVTFIRFRMASKNASSSAYSAVFGGFLGLRTAA